MEELGPPEWNGSYTDVTDMFLSLSDRQRRPRETSSLSETMERSSRAGVRLLALELRTFHTCVLTVSCLSACFTGRRISPDRPGPAWASRRGSVEQRRRGLAAVAGVQSPPAGGRGRAARLQGTKRVTVPGAGGVVSHFYVIIPHLC